ncbi:MFS transporter [Halalkalibacterium ligniniphilum]|uniref:MFS transporter n=1 Tax=Halalkalibacterium ligniniphilum TaxID=1134413 RepID=UPI000349B154|nr:MFS transporter [Halalkalibacterium ligniniphilum]
MPQPLQIFMEYKIEEQKIDEYEREMERILATLQEFGASNIQWFVAADQPHLYVEMFEVPTASHYHAIKKLRQSEEHRVFGSITPMIKGGAKQIHCWAFEKRKGQGEKS